MQTFVTPLFFVLFALAVIWLISVWRVFESLKSRHSAMFKELGSPSFGNANSMGSLFKFLYSRRPESLNDETLLGLVKFMRVIFFIYLAGFGVLLYYVLNQKP